jgi:hypothetical protein
MRLLFAVAGVLLSVLPVFSQPVGPSAFCYPGSGTGACLGKTSPSITSPVITGTETLNSGSANITSQTYTNSNYGIGIDSTDIVIYGGAGSAGAGVSLKAQGGAGGTNGTILLRAQPAGIGYISTTIPTVTGTGAPTIATGSTDSVGEVTAGTTATSVVITFSSVKTNAPFCTVTDQSTLASFTYTISTSAITITQTANSGNKIDYICFQH